MNRNGLANILSWLAAIVTVCCLVGLMIAASVFTEPVEARTQSSGFVFLLATSWLAVLGLATTVFGGISLLLGTGEARRAQVWRSRVALFVGAISLALGLAFGLPIA